MAQELVRELEQPGKAVDFFSDFSDEKYQYLVDIGFYFHADINVKAIADGSTIIHSDIFHVVGKINSLKALKVFINRGHDVNELDNKGYNVLSYALDSLVNNSAIVYILLQNSIIQNNQFFKNVFENEDADIFCTILLEFSYKTTGIVEMYNKKGNDRVKQLVSNYKITGDVAYDAVRMYLNDQYPNLDQISEKTINEITKIEELMGNLNSTYSDSDFINFDRTNVVDKSRNIIGSIIQLNNILISFSKTYVGVREVIRKTPEFLESALKSLQKSQEILEGNKEEFDALLKDPPMDPFVLLGPAELLNKRKGEGLENISKLMMEVKEKKQSFMNEIEGIPHNEFVLKMIQTKLKNVSKLFCSPSGLYYKFMFIRTAFEKLYNKIRFEESAKMFIAKSTNTKYTSPIPDIENINSQFIKESARIRTAWMQCIMPISQPKIDYHPTDDEIFYDEIEEQVRDIIENFNRSNEIENSLEEMSRGIHLCSNCHRKVAVYVCQNCWNLISCADCGPIVCPQCKAQIDGLRYLVKTIYPGIEFREHYELLFPPNVQSN